MGISEIATVVEEVNSIAHPAKYHPLPKTQIMVISEIATLVEEINCYARSLLLPGDDRKDMSERARRSLVTAAEKLVLASRRPDENLYATATNV